MIILNPAWATAVTLLNHLAFAMRTMLYFLKEITQ
jgi:hypothetical protein